VTKEKYKLAVGAMFDGTLPVYEVSVTSYAACVRLDMNKTICMLTVQYPGDVEIAVN
jgi:hypothetical protein